MIKSHWRIKLAAAFALPGFLWLSPADAAELILADGGRTEYQVVSARNARKIDRLAAADLAATLNEITGADFSIGAGKKKNIFIGIAAPGDKNPLKAFERRIVTQDGNLYIYGEGRYGNNNAVYDFLYDELNCRWFNVSGDKKIPKSQKLVIGELKKSLIPSIPYLTADRVNNRSPQTLAFARRNALVDEHDIFIAGHHLHAGQRIIPSGKIPPGGRIGNTFGPAEHLKDKAYFETHPEYFSMNSSGKRNYWMQLCYSNMEMRDEFIRNLKIIIRANRSRGKRKLLGVGQDDNRGPFCWCRNCKALMEKYDHPAGPYYDFLLDLSARFAKSHPNITLCFLAYRKEQTLYPSKLMTKLPANLIPSYAPLGCDFSKPLDHRPNNAIQNDSFKKWADIAGHLHWWSYPTPYPRPIVSFPLIANIHRIAENFRLAHKYKTLYAYCQFGSGFYSSFGFNDLRTYLLARLCRDITLDENKIIAEYMEGCYGKAAPLMRSYLAELEKLEAGTNFYLRWNPDVLSLPYITGDNLIRWERSFDEMEKLAAGDDRILLNIRRARFNLDETVLAKWPYLTLEQLKAAGDLEKVIARAAETILADQQDLYRELRTTAPQKYELLINNSVNMLNSGLNQFVVRARGGKALPQRFAKYKILYRLLPFRNREALDTDPAAPFGQCTVWPYILTKSWFIIRTFDPARQPHRQNKKLPKPLSPGRIAKIPADGKYRYYHLGAVRITQDCQIACIDPGSGWSLSHLYDPKAPDRLYDIHAAVAVSPDRKQVKYGEIVVIPSPHRKPSR